MDSFGKLVTGVVSGFFCVLVLYASIGTVPAGQVAVATLFGEVQEETYKEGIHIANPFVVFRLFDVRQKSLKESIGVPSRDQLITNFDISIQYRIEASKASLIYRDTGTPESLVSIHLVPLIRSKARELGKSVDKAEWFFKQEIQSLFQSQMLEVLALSLEPKGLIIQDILIRNVALPSVISDAVIAKKKIAQDIKKAELELSKFKIDQAKREAEAQAVKTAKETEALTIKIAAEAEAGKRRILADAEAYAITKVNKALGSAGGNYIKLQALESLKAISKDPGSKTYFINGDSPSPLPLMNIK